MLIQKGSRLGAVEVPTPESDKMLAVHDKSQSIGDFLEWMQQRGVRLAEHHHHDDGCYEGEGLQSRKVCGLRDGELVSFSYTTERLLAKFFEIDLDKVEKEKRAILDAIR